MRTTLMQPTNKEHVNNSHHSQRNIHSDETLQRAFIEASFCAHKAKTNNNKEQNGPICNYFSKTILYSAYL